MNVRLSAFFEGIATKTLSEVECSRDASNQHEFNGVAALKRILGTEKLSAIPARLIRLCEDTSETDVARLTWYDSRASNPSRSSEYRLYFSSNRVMEASKAGDTLVIAKTKIGELAVIVAEAGTTAENQLGWIFGLEKGIDRFSVVNLEGRHEQIDFLRSQILEELGFVPAETPETSYSDLIEQFGMNFPPAAIMSDLARRSLPDVDALADPDGALLSWVEREELLFRELERKIVSKRLENGFQYEGVADVDAFVSYSLSVQNRRKSRSGLALENHVAKLLVEHGISFTANGRTEGRKTPDFVFPGIDAYRNPAFPQENLFMLGAKTSCKDRWRQVLSEACRIERKHLLTLEAGISSDQTEEMRFDGLQLVLPMQLHTSYSMAQRDWLMSLADFLALVKDHDSDRSLSFHLVG